MGLIRTLALPILAMLAWGVSSQAWAAPLSESDRQIYAAAFDRDETRRLERGGDACRAGA